MACWFSVFQQLFVKAKNSATHYSDIAQYYQLRKTHDIMGTRVPNQILRRCNNEAM